MIRGRQFIVIVGKHLHRGHLIKVMQLNRLIRFVATNGKTQGSREGLNR